MSTYKNLISLGAAAVFALGLAACSSSSDGTKTGDDGTMEPSPVSLAGLTNHGLTAQTLTIKAGATATVGNVTFSCPSGGADCAVAITVADGTASVTSDGGMATAAYSAAYNKQVADAGKEASARALGLQAAITTQATEAAPTVAVTRAVGEAASIKISGGGTGSGAYKADAAPAAIAGWSGASFMRGAATEYVTVYSNIAEPEVKAFNQANLQTLTGDDTTVSETDSFTVISTHATHVSWSGALPSLTDKKNADNVVTSRSFEGAFGGAMGDFMCTGDATACDVSVGSNGVINFTGTWSFTAGKDAKLNLPDTDHLRFGWWMDSPDKADADGKYVYKFRTFYGGSTTAFTGNDIGEGSNNGDVKGTATYSGKAAGAYVTRSFDDARKATGGTAGEFTADVTLNAAFGGDDVAASKKHKISGEITNFMESGKSLGWSVSLKEATIATSGTSAIGLSGTTQAFDGVTPSGTGSWSGAFYGSAKTAAPTGVAGKFTANVGATDIAGGFGATKTK